ncbi:phosphonate metabolism transcriptional regulator PhnF [Gymnodinialimonas ceratoperidinii]|uniref:Phosphonate metabolism transcriptional regulator PhnF n=1 Tax=Gymnodinialimonas ceratoperidinii TaxID=2856823 RepID=A0A8F6TYC0_9RHOB|nr:phosphonate metabolism transcriptional regulator PhnF [Gymnodinialimonas ceratoperidinii]QXT41171.1 phosphonate metabolism transcriptional regulator PhnF [Gymnodinialimonas ceratoperidinii]
MGRAALWNAIHDTLAEEIARGHYAPGDRLPTEAQLADRFGVNRHTVRRALAALAEDDIVFSRRGAGVFVRHVPTPYPIGRRTRFHQNLLAANRVPEKRVLHLETRSANAQEAQALQLGDGALVHVYEGLSLSDGLPLATFRSVFPAERFPDLLSTLRDTRSVTQSFAAEGITDYTRARTEVTAETATRTQATLLEIRAGDPILKTTGTNVDAEGAPIEVGSSWFAADRVVLTVSDAPSA